MSHMITITLHDSLITAGQHQPPLLARCAIWVAVKLTEWDLKHRTRQQLKQLDDHLLRDVGIERDAAYTEAARPFWR